MPSIGEWMHPEHEGRQNDNSVLSCGQGRSETHVCNSWTKPDWKNMGQTPTNMSNIMGHIVQPLCNQPSGWWRWADTLLPPAAVPVHPAADRTSPADDSFHWWCATETPSLCSLQVCLVSLQRLDSDLWPVCRGMEGGIKPFKGS